MTKTTEIRQQKALKELKKKIEENEQRDVRNPVESACRELSGIIGYSERYLRDLYYGY